MPSIYTLPRWDDIIEELRRRNATPDEYSTVQEGYFHDFSNTDEFQAMAPQEQQDTETRFLGARPSALEKAWTTVRAGAGQGFGGLAQDVAKLARAPQRLLGNEAPNPLADWFQRAGEEAATGGEELAGQGYGGAKGAFLQGIGQAPAAILRYGLPSLVAPQVGVTGALARAAVTAGAAGALGAATEYGGGGTPEEVLQRGKSEAELMAAFEAAGYPAQFLKTAAGRKIAQSVLMGAAGAGTALAEGAKPAEALGGGMALATIAALMRTPERAATPGERMRLEADLKSAGWNKNPDGTWTAPQRQEAPPPEGPPTFEPAFQADKPAFAEEGRLPDVLGNLNDELRGIRERYEAGEINAVDFGLLQAQAQARADAALAGQPAAGPEFAPGTPMAFEESYGEPVRRPPGEPPGPGIPPEAPLGPATPEDRAAVLEELGRRQREEAGLTENPEDFAWEGLQLARPGEAPPEGIPWEPEVPDLGMAPPGFGAGQARYGNPNLAPARPAEVPPEGEGIPWDLVSTPKEQAIAQQMAGKRVEKRSKDRPSKKAWQGMSDEDRYRNFATDKMTGLGSRVAFGYDFDPMNESLLMLDVNGLTALNNRYGHQAGDAYIQKVAQLLREHEGGDVFAHRLGGDEFAVRVPHDRADALKAALQDAAGRVEFRYELPDGRVIAKRGVEFEIGKGSQPEAEASIREADAATEAAKREYYTARAAEAGAENPELYGDITPPRPGASAAEWAAFRDRARGLPPRGLAELFAPGGQTFNTALAAQRAGIGVENDPAAYLFAAYRGGIDPFTRGAGGGHEIPEELRQAVKANPGMFGKRPGQGIPFDEVVQELADRGMFPDEDSLIAALEGQNPRTPSAKAAVSRGARQAAQAELDLEDHAVEEGNAVALQRAQTEAASSESWRRMSEPERRAYAERLRSEINSRIVARETAMERPVEEGEPLPPSPGPAFLRMARPGEAFLPGMRPPDVAEQPALPGVEPQFEPLAPQTVPTAGPSPEVGRQEELPLGDARRIVTPADVPLREPSTLEEAAAKPVNPREIIDFMRKKFDAVIRWRGFKEKAAGIQRPGLQVIRSAEEENLGVLSHEFGHDFMEKHVGDLMIGLALHRGELTSVGNGLYPDGPPGNYPIWEEGFAQYMHKFLTGRPQEVPAFDRWFRGTYLPAHPQIGKNLQELQGMYGTWGSQGAWARVGAKHAMPAARPLLETGGARPSMALRAKLEDAAIVVKDAVREMLKARGMTEADLPEHLNPAAIIYATQKTHAARVEEMTKSGVRDIRGRVIAPALQDVFAPFGSEKAAQEFMHFYSALESNFRRAQDVARGVPPNEVQAPFSEADEIRVINDGKARPHYIDTVAAITKINQAFLHYMVEAGAVTPEFEARLNEQNPIYLPQQRILDEVERFDPLAKRHGSGATLKDPTTALLHNWEWMLMQGDKARVARSLVNLAMDSPGAGKFVEPVDGPIRGATPIVVRGGGTGYVVFRQDIREALSNMETFRLPRVLNVLLGIPKRTVTLAYTGLNVGFQTVTNPLRDFMVHVLQTGGSRLGVPERVVKGIGEMMAGSEAYERFKGAGFKSTTFVGGDIDALREARRRILGATGSERAEYNITHPVEAIAHGFDWVRDKLSWSEAINRYPEFKRVYDERLDFWKKKGLGDRDAEEAAFVAASVAGADVTVDFKRQGSALRGLGQATPFLTANVAGLTKFARTVRTNPVGALATAMAGLTMPALLMWAAHKDEKWYQELPYWEKALFMHLKVGKTVLRVPMPFEWGLLFAAAPVSVAESIRRKDPKEAEKIGEQIVNNLVPDFIPALFRPWLEVAANKNWFQDKPIESAALQRLLPQDRYLPSTSEVYKAIGSALGVSPLKVEHVVTGYFGSLAREVTNPIKAGRFREAADIPVVGRLVSRQNRPGKSVDDFYEQYLKDEQIYATVQQKQREGDSAGAQRLAARNADALGRLARERKAVEAIRSLRRQQNPQLETDIARQSLGVR